MTPAQYDDLYVQALFDRMDGHTVSSTWSLRSGFPCLGMPNVWPTCPGLLAGMPMPFIHPERRMSFGAALNAFGDELLDLHSVWSPCSHLARAV